MRNAEKYSYVHGKGIPAYATVITPTTFGKNGEPLSGFFSATSMLCDVPLMLEHLRKGVGISYRIFSGKCGGSATPGVDDAMFIASNPARGSSNLVNLLLIIHVLDVAISRVDAGGADGRPPGFLKASEVQARPSRRCCATPARPDSA